MQTKFPSRKRARRALKIKATFLRPEGCDPPGTKAAPSPSKTTDSGPRDSRELSAPKGSPGATGRRPDRRRRSRRGADPSTTASVREDWPAWVVQRWRPRPAVLPLGPSLASSRPPSSTAVSGPQRGLPGPALPGPKPRLQAARPPALPSSRLGPAPRPDLPRLTVLLRRRQARGCSAELGRHPGTGSRVRGPGGGRHDGAADGGCSAEGDGRREGRRGRGGRGRGRNAPASQAESLRTAAPAPTRCSATARARTPARPASRASAPCRPELRDHRPAQAGLWRRRRGRKAPALWPPLPG